MDAKARIKVGPFSRGGYSRQHKDGLDHDFDPDVVLGLFGFLLPEHDDTYFYFTKSKITSDFILLKAARENDLAINVLTFCGDGHHDVQAHYRYFGEKNIIPIIPLSKT
ncbi:MAG: hypothetical protein JRE64_16140 [Deltaproteobacteria bacterium]|nr:hypothetical protein [Deltaproteobacteria bacterium]